MIANLYNQHQRPHDNHASVSDLNLPGVGSRDVSTTMAVPASNADANGVDSILNDLNSDSLDDFDEDDGWEFKCAESEIQTDSCDVKVMEGILHDSIHTQGCRL